MPFVLHLTPPHPTSPRLHSTPPHPTLSRLALASDTATASVGGVAIGVAIGLACAVAFASSATLIIIIAALLSPALQLLRKELVQRRSTRCVNHGLLSSCETFVGRTGPGWGGVQVEVCGFGCVLAHTHTW